MRWPRYLWYLCGKVGAWACGAEEEGLGDVTGCFWVGGLNLRPELVSGSIVY